MIEMISIAAQLRADDMGAGTPMAIAPGTCVLTLDGALPVDHLYPGDRLVTRHGARRIEAIDRVTLAAGTAIVSIAQNALGGRPERDLWLPAGQRIVIRDWRAKALYGQAQVCIAVGQLVDGEYIRLSELPAEVMAYALRFGRPEVFYADGLELASADRLTIPA
ncbi:Hint domain-containing protein [Roseicyclus mahoneyensis]|uniref:Hint domain-containing protein n=1 Tax=Roseicyclus mahoneyensis TaxID=164332 RepID=A0A316GKH3_9RHOB|nr:Hint domain-containing protein [Roseicyclus mahoneyensis]PWK61136.1 Hint domain-containing protein [Roseicyclus mahoneyensis]